MHRLLLVLGSWKVTEIKHVGTAWAFGSGDNRASVLPGVQATPPSGLQEDCHVLSLLPVDYTRGSMLH